MSEVDDLNVAMDKITTSVGAAMTEIQTLAAEIAALPANPDPAAIESAVTRLNTLAANLDAAVNPPAAAAAV